MAITKGYLAKRIYHCTKTHFHVYQLKQDTRTIKAVYQGHNPPEPSENIPYIMEGYWNDHKGHGVQFKIRSYRTEDDYQEIRKISLQKISEMLYLPPHMRTTK